ncbi:hypothetical protein ACFL6L_01970 [candidate division KSB1 bacterium]
MTVGTVFSQQDTKAAAPLEYTITMAGNTVGNFSLEYVGTDDETVFTRSKSKMTFPQGSAEVSGEVHMTKDFIPVSWKSFISASSITYEFSAVFSEGEAVVSRALPGREIPDTTYALSEETLLVDNTQFDLYYFAVRRFLTLEQEKATLNVLFPSMQMTFKASLMNKGRITITIGKKDYNALHVSMGYAAFFFDCYLNLETLELLQLDLPAQQLSVVRK